MNSTDPLPLRDLIQLLFLSLRAEQRRRCVREGDTPRPWAPAVDASEKPTVAKPQPKGE